MFFDYSSQDGRSASVPMPGGSIDGIANHRWSPVVQELHRQVADGPCRGRSIADARWGQTVPITAASTPFAFAQLAEFAPTNLAGPPSTIRSWASEIQISVVSQPLVFQRCLFQPDFGADVFSHFTDRAGKPARTAVGDGVDTSPRSRAWINTSKHHLFGDRVADLHGAARERFRFTGQLGRTERRAVDSVAPGAAADGNDQIIRLDLFSPPCPPGSCRRCRSRPAGCPGSRRSK